MRRCDSSAGDIYLILATLLVLIVHLKARKSIGYILLPETIQTSEVSKFCSRYEGTINSTEVRDMEAQGYEGTILTSRQRAFTRNNRSVKKLH